jgi:hypothetical protein
VASGEGVCKVNLVGGGGRGGSSLKYEGGVGRNHRIQTSPSNLECNNCAKVALFCAVRTSRVARP